MSPERRRNWDAIQPHILAPLPTQSWEFTALSSNRCIQLFQPEMSVQHPLHARHWGHSSEHLKRGPGPQGASSLAGKTVNRMLVIIAVGRTVQEGKS